MWHWYHLLWLPLLLVPFGQSEPAQTWNSIVLMMTVRGAWNSAYGRTHSNNPFPGKKGEQKLAKIQEIITTTVKTDSSSMSTAGTKWSDILIIKTFHTSLTRRVMTFGQWRQGVLIYRWISHGWIVRDKKLCNMILITLHIRFFFKKKAMILGSVMHETS